MSEDTPVSVTMQKDGDVAVIIVNNPPVNALSWHVRWGLKEHFEAALADDGVQAIVLRCDGGTFIAGADISEFGKPRGVPISMPCSTRSRRRPSRSEEHTSELQSLMRI